MLLYVFIAGALMALWLFALVDASRVPASVWTATGRNKIAWVLALSLVSFAASLVYLAIVRRSLHAVQADEMTTAAAKSRRATALSSGGVKCETCGFTSNPVGAGKCRSCGAAM